MQNPKDIKDIGTWIWKTIQDVYSFIQKPFAGIFLLLVSIGWAWYVSDSKFQEGYDAGAKNQLTSDNLNTLNLQNLISELRTEKADMKKENERLQERMDSAKNPDCMEQNEKLFAYVESVKKRFSQENQAKATKLKKTQNDTKKIRNENKAFENLIKNKKQ